MQTALQQDLSVVQHLGTAMQYTLHGACFEPRIRLTVDLNLSQPAFTCSNLTIEPRNMYKVNNKDTRKMAMGFVLVSLLLTLNISHLVQLFLLLTLNM